MGGSVGLGSRGVLSGLRSEVLQSYEDSSLNPPGRETLGSKPTTRRHLRVISLVPMAVAFDLSSTTSHGHGGYSGLGFRRSLVRGFEICRPG